MAVGPLEQQFYEEFVRLLGIADEAPARKDVDRWGELRTAVADRFRTRTRDEWTAVFQDSDACVAPVLSLREAPAHPHLAVRHTFVDHAGITQPAPAPRFSATPAAVTRPPARPGADAAEVAADWDVPRLAEASGETAPRGDRRDDPMAGQEDR
jgi:alpha-methylacyl-CoA racemase